MFGTIARIATKAVPVLGTVVTVASIIVEVAAVVQKVRKK